MKLVCEALKLTHQNRSILNGELFLVWSKYTKQVQEADKLRPTKHAVSRMLSKTKHRPATRLPKTAKKETIFVYIESLIPYTLGAYRAKWTEKIVLVKKITVMIPPIQKAGLSANAPISDMNLMHLFQQLVWEA